METISDAYREELTQLHASSDWGSTADHNAGPEIVRTLGRRGQVVSVLDYGCGKEKLKAFLAKQAPHLEVTGYDPNIPAKAKIPRQHYDAVVSTDVLEHVEPDHLNAVVAHIRSLATKVVALYIACSPTGHYLKDGRDLHLIVEEPSWWREKLGQVPGWVEMEFRAVELRARKDTKKAVYLVYDVVG